MPRKARNGVIRPYKIEVKKTLKDGTTKTYVRWKCSFRGHQYTAQTYRACDTKLRKAIEEENTFGMTSDNNVRFGEYAAAWLERRKADTDPKTFANYTTLVETHLHPYANQKLGEMNATRCARIIDHMKVTDHHGNLTGKKASLSLRKQMRTTLNQIFKSAVADRIIPTNPMQGVPTPKNKDITHELVKERDAFTEQQAHDILVAATHLGIRNGAKEWFRLCTGMRPNEVLGAKLEDLTLATTPDGIPYGSYNVNWKLEELKKDHGCGNHPNRKGIWPCGYKRAASCPFWKWRIPEGFDMEELGGRWCLTRPKSKTGRRIPIVPSLAQAMSAYLKATEHVPNPNGLLFRDDDGNPLDPAEDMTNFRELLKNAGIDNPEGRYRHETRHTTVTILKSMGVDDGLVQEIIGHSSSLMVEHYRHASLDESLSAMRRMEQPLGLKEIGWEA